MATPLLLVCAGGTARETLALLDELDPNETAWRRVGFLDDNVGLHGSRIEDLPVVGGTDCVGAYPDAQCVITCNVPDNPRARLVDKLGLAPDRFATLLHPRSTHTRVKSIGPGSVVFEFCSIAIGVILGNHVIVQRNVTIGHDAVIEDYSTIAPGAVLAGTVHVGPAAYVGSGAVIRENLRIGEGAMVGMGAVVTKDVPPRTTVVGNPARPLPC